MSSAVNVKELAIERKSPQGDLGPPTKWGTRVVLPAALLLGFAGMLAWASIDVLLPRTAVSVVPVEVSRSTVRQEGTPLFQAAGWIEPRPTAIRVAALAPGVVERLLVVEDQPVEKGEPIAYLVDEDAKLALEGARAELKLKEAAVARAETHMASSKTRLDFPVHLEARVASAETRLAEVKSRLAAHPNQVKAAEAKLRYAEQAYQRTKELGSRAATTENEVDRALSELETSRAELNRLREILPTLKDERDALQKEVEALREFLELKTDEKETYGEAQAELMSAKADVARAETAVAEAELRLSRMVISASVTGRILDLVTEPGARLMMDKAGDRAKDGTTVVTMYEPDKLQVRVDVRFENLPQVTVGQPVEVKSPAVENPLKGHVLFLTSIADIQKNTLEVKVSLDDPPSVLKPEMLVDVTFLADKQEQPSEPSEELRIFIPNKFVREGEGGKFVWVADRSAGVARKVSVDLGRPGPDGKVEVLSGLNPSSRLIAGNTEGLSDGEAISITGESID